MPSAISADSGLEKSSLAFVDDHMGGGTWAHCRGCNNQKIRSERALKAYDDALELLEDERRECQALEASLVRALRAHRAEMVRGPFQTWRVRAAYRCNVRGYALRRTWFATNNLVQRQHFMKWRDASWLRMRKLLVYLQDENEKLRQRVDNVRAKQLGEAVQARP